MVPDRSQSGAGSVGGADRERHGLVPAALREHATHLVRERLRLVRRHEGDRAAAEAAAGHPRTDRAGRLRGLDDRVELRHADLEVVAHGDVARLHQLAEPAEVARPQRRDALQHAGVLGHDVLDPPVRDVVEQPLRTRQVLDGQVAQRGHAHRRRAALARLPTVAVAARRVLVLHLRVDDEQHQAGGVEAERHLLHREAAAVEEHRGVTLAEHAGRLVHDPGRRTDGDVLGALADPRQIGAVEPEVPHVVQRDGDRHLDGGGGGEPGADRHVRVDRDVEAVPQRRVVALPDRPGHTERVGGPAGELAGGDGAQVRLDERLVEGGHEADPVVVARRQRDRGRAVDRERQHEAVVVVGVLADQVDPPGGAPEPGGGAAEHALEQRGDGLGAGGHSGRS